MVGEAVEKKLYDAATMGDVATFQQLLQQDPYLVHGVSFPCSRNLLHIAAMHGQTAIVDEVLKINPRLARSSDSQKSSPLHIAVEEGNLEITKRLLLVAPEMCWWRDDQGMNPVHVAAVKGRVMILEEMLQLGLSPARERVHRGQTALHLCVKHCQIETLKVLVEKLGDQVYEKDDDGETLLHLAVRSNEVEVVRYLVKLKKVEALAKNSRGKTAVDILDESFGDTRTCLEMRRRIVKSFSPQSMAEVHPDLTDTAMVVVVLIATMAFQAGVSPPGGVWQEETSSHSAGKAVMATTHPNIYKHFIRANNTAFISSIITILLITTRVPQHDFFHVGIATYSMLLSIASIGVSYGASLMMTNPMETKSVVHVVAIVVSAFLIIFVLAFFPVAIGEMVSWSHRTIRTWVEKHPTALVSIFIRKVLSL